MEGQQHEQVTGVPPNTQPQVRVQYVQAQPQVQYVQQHVVGAQIVAGGLPQVVQYQHRQEDECCPGSSNMIPGQDMGKYSCIEVSIFIFAGLRFFSILMWFISTILIYSPYTSYEFTDPCANTDYCFGFENDYYESAAPGVLATGFITTAVFIIEGSLHVWVMSKFRKADQLEKRKNWLTGICVVDSVLVGGIVILATWMMLVGVSCNEYAQVDYGCVWEEVWEEEEEYWTEECYDTSAPHTNDCSSAFSGSVMMITFGCLLATVHIVLASLACAHICSAGNRQQTVVYVQGNQAPQYQQQIPVAVIQPGAVQVAPVQMQPVQPYIQTQ